MKKLFVTVAILGVFFTPMGIPGYTTASQPKVTKGLASAPAPISAGGGIATAIGLVTAPVDLIFALRGGGTTDFWQYSISENAWVILPNTPAPVDDGGAIVQINSYAFCSQGEGKYCLATLRGGNTTDFWVYDIKANHWCVGPSTPAAVGSGGAIAQLQGSGEIYALRGGATADFWKFDDGVWTKLADTPGLVNTGGGLVGINHGTRSHKRVLYALQGNGSTAVWKYDTETNTWSHQADAPAPIGPGGAITSSNSGTGDEGTLIILQGGGSTKVWHLDIKIEGNVWREINSAPTGVATGGAIAAQVNGCNFALVGGGSNEFFSTGLRDCLVSEVAPDFSINFMQPTMTATPGTKIKARLNITRSNGFTGKITLTQASPMLQGIVIPEVLQIPESDSFTFKIKVKGTAQKGSFPVIFAGADTSGKVRNATLTLVIE
jgi:hypothetical protein